MPKAYVVNEVFITDPERFLTYSRQVPATLTPFGGRYLVRRGATETVEGTPPSDCVVILEFPDHEAARAWRDSAAYQEILKIRDETSTSRVYIIDGYDG